MDFMTSEIYRVPTPDVIGKYSLIDQSKKVFKFYKSAESLEELYCRAIPFSVKEFQSFRLIPISHLHLNDAKLIYDLSEWRNSFINIYPDSRTSTIESTQKWIDVHLVNNENRILFLVIDEFGQRYGHLGIWIRESGVLELDNVLKAPSVNLKGLFSAAVNTLEQWINELVNLPKISLRVLRSNIHAKNFYEKNDYEVVEELFMIWEIDSSGNKFLVSAEEENSNESWLVMSKNLKSGTVPIPVIPTAGPSISAFEVAFTTDAVKSGWNSYHSNYLTKFSNDFSSYVQSKYAIPTDSCTSALHLGLWALDIGPGDEVIVPDLTWVATAKAVRYVGATPVFADVNESTWCIDPGSVRSLLTSKTKAIIPVHLYGYVAPLYEIMEICNQYGLKLLQDAAPGIGSMLNGSGVASYGDFTAFSFQGAKLMVSGEGGVLTTNNQELYKKAFKIADVGRKPGTFWIESLGKKMKMSNLTAALALGQMQSVERQIEKKRLIQSWYKEELEECAGLTFQEEATNTRSIAWMTSINLSKYKKDRDQFRVDLLSKGVDTRPVFPAISKYPIWEGAKIPKPVAERIGASSINLPSGVRLNRSAINFICSKIKEILNK